MNDKPRCCAAFENVLLRIHGDAHFSNPFSFSFLSPFFFFPSPSLSKVEQQLRKVLGRASDVSVKSTYLGRESEGRSEVCLVSLTKLSPKFLSMLVVDYVRTLKL